MALEMFLEVHFVHFSLCGSEDTVQHMHKELQEKPKVDTDAGKPATFLWKQYVSENGLYQALCNLIHGFIYLDESMTDIQ